MSEDSKEGAGTPDRLPPSRWPIWYFGFGHLCLATAGGFVALQPQLYFGSVYHPHAMVPVHLMTLGWITSSIFGALYMIAPMALRLRVQPSWLDGFAFWNFVLGVAGMVSHFWLYEYSGMAWSGLMVAVAAGIVCARIVPGLWRAKVHRAVKLCMTLAFANLFGAFLLGTLAGLGKLGIHVPGHQMTTVWSHAHLAALGWATMMLFGAALRLLPMLIPAAMPDKGRLPIVAAMVFEAGVLGVVSGLYFFQPKLLAVSTLVMVLGIGLFVRQLAWMLRHLKPPPKDLTRPNLAAGHLAQSFLYLLAAASLGVTLAVFEPGLLPASYLMPIYGVCGLVGFLAQMVVGVSARLWPLYAWQRAFAATGFHRPPASPHSLVDQRYRWIVLICWTAALLLLIVGLAFHATPAMEAAGLLLVSAAIVDGVDGARMLYEAKT